MAEDKAIKVLVAEDNPSLRKVIVNIVRKLGYSDVAEAEDGQKAWAQLEKGGVGLLLTDWALPGMSGMDLLRKVRTASGELARLPVVMITAADTKNDILSAGKEGVDAYIIKPFNVATIGEKIDEAIKNRAKA